MNRSRGVAVCDNGKSIAANWLSRSFAGKDQSEAMQFADRNFRLACIDASKSLDLLGNCFDFWSTTPNPMTVNQAVLLALLTQNVDAWNQNDKDTIREKLKDEQVTGRYDFVDEW